MLRRVSYGFMVSGPRLENRAKCDVVRAVLTKKLRCLSPNLRISIPKPPKSDSRQYTIAAAPSAFCRPCVASLHSTACLLKHNFPYYLILAAEASKPQHKQHRRQRPYRLASQRPGFDCHKQDRPRKADTIYFRQDTVAWYRMYFGKPFGIS